MDREGLSKIRRAELMARLSTLDRMIAEQSSRATFIRDMGWNVTLADQRLRLLRDSRQLYIATLSQLLGEDFSDVEDAERSKRPPWLSPK